MKKIILSAVMLLGLAFSAQAQTISKNALGLRLETVAVLELKSLTKEVLEITIG
jgi:Skp family chaperone for outer membrane proteins